jgi:hypothetical protein
VEGMVGVACQLGHDALRKRRTLSAASIILPDDPGTP